MSYITIPLPGLKREVKAGDAVKSAIERTLKVQPCGGCKARQAALNKFLGFRPLGQRP